MKPTLSSVGFCYFRRYRSSACHNPYVISANQNSALLLIADKAETRGDCPDYVSYCRLREQGLRAQAMKALEEFLQQAASWTSSARRDFVQWLCSTAYEVPEGSYGPMPEPLRRKLMEPVLKEWSEEANSAEAYRWLGVYFIRSYEGLLPVEKSAMEYLTRAIEMDPTDQIARLRKLKLNLDGLFYAVHHLPEFYIGDPREDQAFISAITPELDMLQDSVLRSQIRADLEYLDQLVRDWNEFTDSGEMGFQQWCASRARNYQWVRHYYYETKQRSSTD